MPVFGYPFVKFVYDTGYLFRMRKYISQDIVLNLVIILHQTVFFKSIFVYGSDGTDPVIKLYPASKNRLFSGYGYHFLLAY